PLEVSLSVAPVGRVGRTGCYILSHVIRDGGFQRAVIRIVGALAWIALALHLAGLLPDVCTVLDAHGIEVGKDKREVTLLDFLQGCTALFFAVVLGLWISRVTE